MRNLMFTGGWAHDFERTAPILAEVLDSAAKRAGAGCTSDVVTSVDEAADRLRVADYDLLTVYACQFQMLDARYTDADRAGFARSTSPAARAGIGAWLDAGGALLALHTAPICFDDWPAWPQYVGGAWDWSRSWHPSPAEMTIEVATEHDVTRGLSPFTVVDERYCDLWIDPAAEVLTRAAGDDGGQPSLWVLERTDGGRTVYDALGHDERSLTHPAHAELIGRSVSWLGSA